VIPTKSQVSEDASGPGRNLTIFTERHCVFENSLEKTWKFAKNPASYSDTTVTFLIRFTILFNAFERP
jgi:hypothetical protein